MPMHLNILPWCVREKLWIVFLLGHEPPADLRGNPPLSIAQLLQSARITILADMPIPIASRAHYKTVAIAIRRPSNAIVTDRISLSTSTASRSTCSILKEPRRGRSPFKGDSTSPERIVVSAPPRAPSPLPPSALLAAVTTSAAGMARPLRSG